MSNYLSRINNDNFVWDAISRAPVLKRKIRGGSFSVNCPLCISRGHSRNDTRFRLGIQNLFPGVQMHCFNCGAKGKWTVGELISRSVQDFMLGLGVPDSEVRKLKHRAFSYRKLVESNPQAQALMPTNLALTFPPRALPEGAKSFTQLAEENCQDEDFIDAASYLYSRGNEMASSQPFYWTPVADRWNFRRRVIIPFYQKDQIVGWTARLIDDPQMVGGVPEGRYHSSVPADFIFNNRAMEIKERQYVIVVEGVLDALAIDGVSLMGAKLSDKQAAWIDGMQKTVILLPDHDRTGGRLIDAALERGWQVSLPLVRSGSAFNWWEADVKDAAEAVRRYGRLYTLTSILKSASQNRIEITVRRKMSGLD